MLIEPSKLYSYDTLSDGRMVGRFAPLSKIDSLVHAVTTKTGGTFPADADAGAIMYHELGEVLGFDKPGVAWSRQVHGNTVKAVAASGCAGEADGMITDKPGVLLLARSADCPLILAADTKGQAVGIAHASWRGTVQKIAANLISAMARRYDANPADIVACICPSAGPERYEVGQDVYDDAIAQLGKDAKNFFMPAGKEGKYLMDLWAANDSQLQQAGIDFMNMYAARICTITNHNIYPSYRAEGKTVQRFAAVIGRL